MPRLELIFLHSANGDGCFRWPGENSTCLPSPRRLFGSLYFPCNSLIYIAVKLTQFVKKTNVLNTFR
jgi:hypothetical protein